MKKNDRLKKKALRECTMFSPFYDDIFEAFKTRENDRIERKKTLYPKVPSNYPKFTPSRIQNNSVSSGPEEGTLVLVPRHIWRHDRKKTRCDFFKKTKGAKRNRVLQNEIEGLKNELSRTPT